jgi:hypothetical protein
MNPGGFRKKMIMLDLSQLLFSSKNYYLKLALLEKKGHKIDDGCNISTCILVLVEDYMLVLF